MVKSGKGTQTLEKDGKEYILECTWENNKKNGEGILLDPDGARAMKLHFKDDVVGEKALSMTTDALFSKACGSTASAVDPLRSMSMVTVFSRGSTRTISEMVMVLSTTRRVLPCSKESGKTASRA